MDVKRNLLLANLYFNEFAIQSAVVSFGTATSTRV